MSVRDDRQPFTVVVRRIVRPGCERDFEDAMRGFIDESMGAPGSGDFHVLRPSRVPPAPSSREYTVIHRFDDEASRRAFVDSPMYARWMARLRELTESEPHIQEFGGLAGWFTLPGRPMRAPPPRHKMALATFAGVYPLTAVLPRCYGRILPEWHPLAVNIVTTATIVALLTWIVMPLLTRLLAPWLFPTPAPSQEPSP